MTSTAAAPATPLPIARNYLGGAFVGDADSYLDVLDPSDGRVITTKWNREPGTNWMS